jgi:MinD-like ATPase involved in chromosome partitioning or flagellar assembly
MLKLLKSSSCEAKRMLLINKALSETEGLEAYENLKRAIKHFLNESVALLGIINESPSVHTSIKKQQLFLQDSKDDLLNEQLLATSHKLAKSLLLKKSRSKG